MRIFISYISVLLTIVASGTGFSQPQPETYLAPAEVRLKASAFSEAFSELANEVDTRFYDVDGLAEHLDYDLESAVEFVSSKIRYAPYLGVMRGPTGTISTQSGSSWDQAVLLAALINAMGGEAMLGVGGLSEKDAITLLKIGITSETLPDDGLKELNPKAFLEKKLNQTIQDPPSEENRFDYNNYQTAADEIAVRILTQLADAKSPVAESSSERGVEYAKELAEEYVWVRYRDTPNDPWLESHPAFRGLVVPEVQAEKYVAATVPDDQLHRIKIRFFIERMQNGKVVTVPITRDYIRPAANLSAHQIRLGISPNTPNPNSEASFYTPVIDGIVQEGSQSFDIFGLTMSPEDAATGPEIFRTIAQDVGNALGALNEASGNKDKTPRLTGVLLNVTHIAPGGKESTTVRRLTDFREGTPEDHSKYLTSSLTMEVNVGPENGARDLKAMLDSSAILIRQLPYQMALLEKKIASEELAKHPSNKVLPSHEWFTALQLGNAFTPTEAGGKVVRTSPLVIMRRFVSSSDTGFKVAVDIQHNAVRAFTLTESQGLPMEDAQLALRQGVLETLVEGELIGVSGVADWAQIDDLRIISSSEMLESDPIWNAATANVKDRLAADLTDAGILIIPNGQMQRWWKVNVNTGQSLGMGEYGGQETIEEAILEEGIMLELIGNTVGGFFFTKGLFSGAEACASKGGSGSFETCCMVGMSLLNGGMAAVGITSSNIVSETLGAAAGAIFSLTFDITTGNSDYLGDAVNNTSIGVCEYATGG